MRKNVLILLLIGIGLLVASCGNRKTAADYQGMIDSIRKAETEQQLLGSQGEKDPVLAFFDSLTMKALPMKYEPEFVAFLPQMKKVPAVFNGRFDYESNVELLTVKLPSYGNFHVMLMAEKLDSVSTSLYLCTMNQSYVLVDRLCIYEQKVKEKDGKLGLLRQEYYITSDYEITLVCIYRSEEEESDQEEWARRYKINKEGNFEEVIIEL